MQYFQMVAGRGRATHLAIGCTTAGTPAMTPAAAAGFNTAADADADADAKLKQAARDITACSTRDDIVTST